MDGIGQNKRLDVALHQQVMEHTTDAMDFLETVGQRLLLPLDVSEKTETRNHLCDAGHTAIPTNQTLKEDGHEYALFYSVQDSLLVEEGSEPPQLPDGYHYKKDEAALLSGGKVSYNLVLPDGTFANKSLRGGAIPGSASFQEHQTSQVDNAITQGRVNTTAPNNVVSRQLLQGALLQSNFQRSQSANEPSKATQVTHTTSIANRLELVQEYAQLDPSAKENPRVTLQFLQENKGTEPSLDDIPLSLREMPEIMSALVTRSEGRLPVYEQLSDEMKSHPSVIQAFVETKKAQFGAQITEAENRQSPGANHSEKALALIHFPSDIRKFVQRKVDGSRTDTLDFGRKDALVTNTEVLATMDRIFAKETPLESDVEILQKLSTVLDRISSDGIDVRVAGTGDIGSDGTLARDFDEARLGQLQQLVEKRIGRWDMEDAKDLIRAGNRSKSGFAKIPDAFKYAVFGYTTEDYISLNKALRSGNISEDQQLYIDGIAEGLRQMPSHQGIVWRGAQLSQELIDGYTPGKEVIETAFTSTSYGPQPAFSNKNVYYCIQLKDEGSSGKRVDHLSSCPNEREVLINAGTKFKVLANESVVTGKKHNGEDQTKTYIYLQEI